MPRGLGQTKLMRTEWYPQPHEMKHGWFYELDNALIDSTMYPIIMYDEGLGTPSDQETHPENAAFAVVNRPNCFVNSRINDIKGQLKLYLTSKAIDDNIPSIRCAFDVIKMSFLENYDAKDELSGSTIKSELELQTESTDRQGYPLFNGTKMPELFANSALLDAAVPGLTGTQVMEGVAFNPTAFYNVLHWTTIRGMLKSSQRGLKWLTLTPNKPVANISISIDSKVKAMNEYTLYALLVHVHGVDEVYQNVVTADITASTNYVGAQVWFRYNEWNPDFNFKRI